MKRKNGLFFFFKKNKNWIYLVNVVSIEEVFESYKDRVDLQPSEEGFPLWSWKDNWIRSELENRSKCSWSTRQRHEPHQDWAPWWCHSDLGFATWLNTPWASPHGFPCRSWDDQDLAERWLQITCLEFYHSIQRFPSFDIKMLDYLIYLFFDLFDLFDFFFFFFFF